MKNEQQQKELIISDEGLKATLERMLEAGKVEDAIKLFDCREAQARRAIMEYNPETHAIMSRMDKVRKNKTPYETNKLPRSWQRVINETCCFFMFGNPINFILSNDTDEASKLKPYFTAFKNFAEDTYFHERMREAKRVAGSETEAAKLYTYYVNKDTNELKVNCRVLANSKNQTLYTLFSVDGDLVAFACGYYMRNLDNQTETHYDIYTSTNIYKCVQLEGNEGWIIDNKTNEIGKIPVIYYRQRTEWDGMQPRIERDEWSDSKRSDIVEYFGDPYLLVSRDVVGNRFANAEEVGKVIAVDGEKSKFEFVAPPDGSDMITEEKKVLKTSIQQDSFTPDWTYDSIMGLGTLSGEAMRRVNLPGYVKRANRAELYNELITREIHLIIAIMRNIIYIDDEDMRNGLAKMRISFTYQDPFVGGIEDNSTEIATLMGCGAMSIRSGIEMNRNVVDKDAEEERVWEEMERKMLLEEKVKAAVSAQTESTNENNTEE